MVSQVCPSRRPSTTSGTTSSDGSSSRKANDPNATGPLPGTPDLVLHVRVRDELAPPVPGPGEPVRAGDLEAGGLAPADQALPVADPGERVAGVREALQQGAHEVDRLGPHGPVLAGRRRDGLGRTPCS